MPRKHAEAAQALLDAHVQFILNQLEGKSLQALIERELDAILDGAGKLTLGEAVTAQMVKDTVRHYAVELELGGGIPELVGDIARIVYEHKVHEHTRLVDLVSDRQFREMLDKVLEMKDLRRRLVHETTANPLYTALASDILFHGIRGYVMRGPVTRGIPGARSVMKLGQSVIKGAGLDDALEINLRKYIHRNIKATLKESERFLLSSVDDDRVRDFVLEIWDAVKTRRLSLFREYVTSRDVEEWFIVGYEYWRELRRSEYYSLLINAGIDAFFGKYGDTPLRELLDEVGLQRHMLLADAMRFAPPAIKALKKKKLLEPLVRRNLQDFYRSGVVERILSGG
jgi:hypothetical protein